MKWKQTRFTVRTDHLNGERIEEPTWFIGKHRLHAPSHHLALPIRILHSLSHASKTAQRRDPSALLLPSGWPSSTSHHTFLKTLSKGTATLQWRIWKSRKRGQRKLQPPPVVPRTPLCSPAPKEHSHLLTAKCFLLQRQNNCYTARGRREGPTRDVLFVAVFLTSKLYLYITTVQSESLACKIGVFHIYNRYTIIY